MKILYKSYLSKRNSPQNLLAEDAALFSKEIEKTIPAIGILELKNVYILNDTVFCSEKLQFYDSFTHLHKLNWKSKLKRAFILKNKNVTTNSAVFVTNEWSKGYFHWMTECLTKLILIENEKNVLLPHEYKNISFIVPSLSILGFIPLFYDANKPLKVKKLILPSHTGTTGNYNQKIVNQLRERLLQNFDDIIPFRKIYISREKALKRRILNEDLVVKLLQEFEYEIHFFEDYTFEKQAEIMREASILVSLHGAGLTNIINMPEGATVFELRFEGDASNNCYFTLASDLNHYYYYQLCPMDNQSKTFHDGNVTVDIELFKKNLMLINSRNN